jgi:hypothetical protein
MARWRWALLISELFLFALILVLPQVDLPDTTFRDGAAPVVARLQLTAPPAMSASLAGAKNQPLRQSHELLLGTALPVSGLTSADRRSLLCALVC